MENKGVGYRLANWLTSKPWIALAIVAVSAVLLIPNLKHLQSDFSYRIWFREEDPLLKRFDLFERRFGNDESLAIILHSPSGIFDVKTAETLRNVTREMWQVPEIIRVDSLSNYNWVHADGDDIIVEPLIPEFDTLTPELLAKRREIALHHETLPQYLVSKDGKSAVIFAVLKPGLEKYPDYKLVVDSTREMLKKYETGDISFHLTGGVEISNSFRVATMTDMERIVPLVLGIAIVSLIVFFRRISAMVLAMSIVVFSVLLTLGTVALLGIKLNNVTSLLPQILVAVGLADSIHILVSFFSIRSTGLPRREAAALALRKNFIPTILTSVTTCFGFLSFATAKVVPIANLGLIAGLGTIYAWFLTYLLLGSLLSLLPIPVKHNPHQEDLTSSSERGIRLANFFQKNHRSILVGFLLLSLGSLALTVQNTVNSDPLEYFSERMPLTQANRFMEEHVGSALGAEMVINSGEPEGIKDPAFLQKVETFQDWINSKPYVTKTVSIIDILKHMNRSLHGEDNAYFRVPKEREQIAQQLFLYTMSLPQGMDLNNQMTLANDAIRLSIFWKIHDSDTSLRLYREFEEKAREIGLNAEVTGKVPLYQKMNDYIVQSFVISLTLAVFLISLTLFVTFRSVKIAGMALIPNVVPLLVGGAIVFLMGRYIDVGLVMVASITFGIAVDDTIHFLSNYQRLRKAGYSARDAIANVFTHTGSALVITSVVLVAAFGSFVLASFMPNQNFGILSAVVLMIALVLDLTCLPALLFWMDEGKEAQSLETKPIPSAEVQVPVS